MNDQKTDQKLTRVGVSYNLETPISVLTSSGITVDHTATGYKIADGYLLILSRQERTNIIVAIYNHDKWIFVGNKALTWQP